MNLAHHAGAIVSFLAAAGFWVLVIIAIVGSGVAVLKMVGRWDAVVELLIADDPYDDPPVCVGERETQLAIYSTARRSVRAEPGDEPGVIE